MAHEGLIGKHTHLFAKPENFTPPTGKEEDCICGGFKSGGKSRALIANCPCCDGVQVLVVDVCDCEDPSFIKFRVTLPPDNETRIRRIKNVEAII
jgi:hypothetical protein